MSGLHVDAAGMDSQGRSTINSASDLNSKINSLNGHIDSLMGIWRGEAANQFNQSAAKEIVNLREFEKLIEEMGQRITQGAVRFDETEEENARIASNLFNN